MNARDALLFLDLDKGPSREGPLFDEPRRRLQADPRLRTAYGQFQALRALAWECAPEPGERLIKQALLQSRREQVKGQLARAIGNEDQAREILLGRTAPRTSLPAWFWAVLLLGAAILGGLAWREGLLLPLHRSPPAGPLPFEFPATPPVDAALSEPSALSAAADSEDVRHEDAASREARLLMREHLKDAEERSLGLAPRAPAPAPLPRPRPAPTAAAPRAPRPAPTTVATLVEPTPSVLTAPVPMAPAPAGTSPADATQADATQVVPDAAPSVSPGAALAEAAEASLRLSSLILPANGTLRITLNLPEKKDLDLRLFSKSGRPVRLLASGSYGPGRAEFDLSAFDDSGASLPAGTYYLRAMTAWFSRVETIQIQP